MCWKGPISRYVGTNLYIKTGERLPVSQGKIRDCSGFYRAGYDPSSHPQQIYGSRNTSLERVGTSQILQKAWLGLDMNKPVEGIIISPVWSWLAFYWRQGLGYSQCHYLKTGIGRYYPWLLLPENGGAPIRNEDHPHIWDAGRSRPSHWKLYMSGDNRVIYWHEFTVGERRGHGAPPPGLSMSG